MNWSVHYPKFFYDKNKKDDNNDIENNENDLEKNQMIFSSTLEKELREGTTS